MNPFESLPNELIVAHCEELDAVSLAKLSEAYERVYYVCRDVLKRKKDAYQEKRLNDKVARIVANMEKSVNIVYGFDFSEILFDIHESFRNFYDASIAFPRAYGLSDNIKVKTEIQFKHVGDNTWYIYAGSYFIDPEGVTKMFEFVLLGMVVDIFGFVKLLVENGIEPHGPTHADIFIP